MNIIGKRNIFFTLSIIYILLGIIALAIWGLNFGLDFIGGNLLEIKFNQEVSLETVRDTLKNLDFAKNSVVQKTADSYMIKTSLLDKQQEQKLKSVLNERVGEYEEIRLESIGPTVTKNLTKNAIISVVLASVMIVIYIAIAFRGIPKPASSWRFGIAAIIALIHDIFILIGSFAIFGHFFGFQIDALFITAILTVLGYSVNDTIVIFDRIRENLNRYPSKSFEQVTNDSLNQTLARSINTTFTTVIPLFAILAIGGTTLKPFVLALTIGIIVGAYSSIFVASPILVIWQNFVNKKQRLV